MVRVRVSLFGFLLLLHVGLQLVMLSWTSDQELQQEEGLGEKNV